MAILFQGIITTRTSGKVKLIIDRIADGRSPDAILIDPTHPVPDTNVQVLVRKPDGTWYNEISFIAEYLTIGELRNVLNLE